MKNTIPSPFFVVSLFVARLWWRHRSNDVNNPAHSIAVLNCSGNANRPELSRTVPYRAVPNRTVPCSGKAPLVALVPVSWNVSLEPYDGFRSQKSYNNVRRMLSMVYFHWKTIRNGAKFEESRSKILGRKSQIKVPWNPGGTSSRHIIHVTWNITCLYGIFTGCVWTHAQIQGNQ